MTTGATGGKTHKLKMGREEARGGERDSRAGKVAGDMELGRGDLKGGETNKQKTDGEEAI